MPNQNEHTVYGPYEQENRWRVVVVRDDGSSASRKFKSKAEARRFIDSVKAQTSNVTMKSSVDAYCKSLAERGLAFGTYDRAEDHLIRLLKLDENGDRPINWVAQRGQELYDKSQAGVSVDTHRNALAAGKSWGRFCTKKGWLRFDPFEEIEGMGRRKKGKPQLRVDEARLLTDFLLARCTPAVKPEAVAVLTVLFLGNRASEVIERDVRDLDDGGTLLWIPDSKTETGKRMLEVPEILQPLLRELGRDRIGAAPLFRNRAGERPTRSWIGYWCHRLCKLAKVPEIGPQGFRGTHGSIARRGGATGRIVQEQLGHATLAMTEGGAYVQRSAIDAAESKAVALRLLKGGRR